MDIEDIEVFVGIDVGKTHHWATALTKGGKKVFDKALPNDEARLRALYEKPAAHGHLLVVVDQPATIGALAVAVARDMGITVGYLPGLSMRRIADLTPGSAKTDAKDAAVIAGAARTMPHTLRAISTSDEDAAALSMLTGFDLDLARQVNQTANRIRGPCTQTPPRPGGHPGTSAGARRRPGRPVAARRRPHRVEEGRQGPHRRQAQEARRPAPRRLGRQDRIGPGPADRHRHRHRGRRHGAAPPGPPAHRPALPAGRRRRPGRDPGAGPPSSRGPDLHAGCRGPGRSRLPGRDPGQDLRHRRPAGLPHPARPRSHAAQAHRSAASASAAPATRDSNTPCSCPPSPP